MLAVANSPQALHKPTQAKSKYRPEIDGLRAFAVVAVIINHFNKELLPSGYLGVDIFFVISGYVITSSLADRKSKNFLDFLTGFYERRIKRLVPALVVFVLITSVLISLFNPEPGVALTTGITSLFGLSNIYLFKTSTDYFAQSTELNPFTHTWSLGVEEQFYLLFPFLIWFSGFGQQTTKGARNLFFWVGALTIASLLGFIYLYQVNQPAAYFLTPSRFWEMAAGCLLFIGFQKRARIEQALERVPPLLVVTAMVGVMFLPVSAAVPATTGIVVLSAILVACLKQGTNAYKIFTLNKVVFVGQISYSLYLWHWSILSISRWTIGIHWWSVPFQILLMLCFAVASYEFIEKPVRNGDWTKNRLTTLTIGITIPIGVSGILFAWTGNQGYRFIYLGANTRCIPYQDNTCQPHDFPHLAVTPYIKGTRLQRKPCFQYEGALTTEVADRCTIPPSRREHSKVFVAGSSYAHHLTPAFQALREESGVGIAMLTHPACDLDPLPRNKIQRDTCEESNKTRWEYILDSITPRDILFTGGTGYKVKMDSVLQIADSALNKKFNVVYFTPIPSWTRLEKDINDICIASSPGDWFLSQIRNKCGQASEIPRNAYTEQTKNSIAFLRSVEKKNPYFHVYPIHDILCSNDACQSHRKGIRLYRDNAGHISLPAAKEIIGKDLKDFLKSKRLLK